MKQTKSTALYQTPFSKAYWRDAAMELKDIRIPVFAALMIALRVALKSLGIPIAADLKNQHCLLHQRAGEPWSLVLWWLYWQQPYPTPWAVCSSTRGIFFPFIFIEIAGSLVFALFLYRTRSPLPG